MTAATWDTIPATLIRFERASATSPWHVVSPAVPVVLGGDDSVPIPLFQAFEGRGTFTVLQVDAHIDWRDDFNSVRDGLSSPIRRASEMDHIKDIFQIGIRAQGLEKCDEIGGMRWGDLDGRRQMFQAVRADRVRWAIPEDVEDPSLVGT